MNADELAVFCRVIKDVVLHLETKYGEHPVVIDYRPAKALAVPPFFTDGSDPPALVALDFLAGLVVGLSIDDQQRAVSRDSMTRGTTGLLTVMLQKIGEHCDAWFRDQSQNRGVYWQRARAACEEGSVGDRSRALDRGAPAHRPRS